MVIIRQLTGSDRAVWVRMRAALWPDETPASLSEGIDEILGSGDAWGFIAEGADGTPAGFAEIAIRKYANGCESRPVPFLEGIWVAPPFRRHGVGAQLIAHVERFLLPRGYCEIGSDAELHNVSSHAAHRGWGFSETERVVYFRKVLAGPVQAKRRKQASDKNRVGKVGTRS
jgi:aminoglycoside 6'-N-acetyltransferase I